MTKAITLGIAGIAGVAMTMQTASAQTAPWLQPFDYQ